MNNHQKKLQLRRERVINLYSEGRSQEDIAREMQISQSTIHRDLQFERRRINNNNDKLETYLEEQLPFEHHACIVGINRIIRMTWEIAWQDFGRKPNIHNQLSLGKQGYSPSICTHLHLFSTYKLGPKMMSNMVHNPLELCVHHLEETLQG